ncbi:hypothetical protein JHK82_022622 [Glycine max]|nr:hypothetical protein JHK85_023113 [Glycine max]KAG5137891.1 hypothetical protein JHK82_022622 [Glycine max]
MCVLHSTIALTCGALMIFYSKEISVLRHGFETASKLQETTPHDQLLIDTSDSFSGLLLFTIGFLLLMVAFVKDIENNMTQIGLVNAQILDINGEPLYEYCSSSKRE